MTASDPTPMPTPAPTSAPELTEEEIKAQEEARKEAELDAAEHKLRDIYEPETHNGVRPDWDFKEKNTSVDKTDLIIKQIDKSNARIQQAKTMDDLAIAVFMEFIWTALELLTEYLKAKREKMKEVRKKEKEAIETHKHDALKAKGLTTNALASRLAYRTQEWLNDISMLPRNEDGSLKRWGLTRAQRHNYKKALFAKKLPVVKGLDVFDFSKFSQSQKKQYTKYMLEYATKNPTFRKYIENMTETYARKADLEKIAQIGTEMNLKYKTGQLYHIRSRDRAA